MCTNRSHDQCQGQSISRDSRQLGFSSTIGHRAEGTPLVFKLVNIKSAALWRVARGEQQSYHWHLGVL
eukprot:1586152-Amphidinium_carterae.1